MRIAPRVSLPLLAAALLPAGLLPAGLAAQQPAEPPAFPQFTVNGRLHVQGYWFDNDEIAAAGIGNVGPESNFFIRRARIQVNGRLTERVAFVIQPSFENGRGAEPNLRLRDAFIDVRLSPDESPASVTVRFGQEKRPISRLELTSSNSLVAIERGAGRGLLGRATNNLFDRSGLIAHDVGASVIVDADVFTVQAGVYNGQGESFNDVNDAKSYGVRATVNPIPRLGVGAAYFSHDAIVEPDVGLPDSSARNDAWEVDAQWGRPGSPGLYLLGEYLRGEDATAERNPIGGYTVIGAWHQRLPNARGWLHAIEPALRWDSADPNLDVDDDASRIFSAVMGFYFSPRAHFRVGYERQMFESDAVDAIQGIRTAMSVSF